MGGELIYQIYRSKVATRAHQASMWDDLGGQRPYQACLKERYDVRLQRAKTRRLFPFSLALERSSLDRTQENTIK